MMFSMKAFKELFWCAAVVAVIVLIGCAVSQSGWFAPKTFTVVVTDSTGTVSSLDSCSAVEVESGVNGYSVSYTGTFHSKHYLTRLQDVSVHPIVLAPEYQKQCEAE